MYITSIVHRVHVVYGQRVVVCVVVHHDLAEFTFGNPPFQIHHVELQCDLLVVVRDNPVLTIHILLVRTGVVWRHNRSTRTTSSTTAFRCIVIKDDILLHNLDNITTKY